MNEPFIKNDGNKTEDEFNREENNNSFIRQEHSNDMQNVPSKPGPFFWNKNQGDLDENNYYQMVEEEENTGNVNNTEEFLYNLKELHRDLVETNNQKQQFFKIVKSLDDLVHNLSKKIRDPADKTVRILDVDFKEDNFIIMLMSLGFEITHLSENELVLVLTTEPSPLFLATVLEKIRSLYLHDSEFIMEVKRQEREKLEEENNPNIARARFLAEKHEQRLQKQYQPSSNRYSNSTDKASLRGQRLRAGNPTVGRNNASYSRADTININNQMQEYRQKMRDKFLKDNQVLTNGSNPIEGNTKLQKKVESPVRTGELSNQPLQNRMKTGKEIEDQRIEEDKVRFGHKALELTNEFRAANGLPPLAWSQELCDIGMEHSRDMAHGKVPFGHENFDKRCAKIPFARWSAAENVALNSNALCPPEIAVKGWIKSPGHRKNLLSNSNVCGIACYRASNGTWYFTQLFASKVDRFI